MAGQSADVRAEMRNLNLTSITLQVLDSNQNSILRCCALGVLQCLASDVEGRNEIVAQMGPLKVGSVLKVGQSAVVIASAAEVLKAIQLLGCLCGKSSTF